ncbi:hypothetical protein FGO68_gene10352 [Halteria grandinella]|uniref:Uncharacterized protein n=1 Tax=Halteria grandinella TaxID=5974 RepID=A0A8J8SWZ1_HALGN|nr:hypothetical protein FGO68_gene10352 [Halteria grandinella]
MKPRFLSSTRMSQSSAAPATAVRVWKQPRIVWRTASLSVYCNQMISFSQAENYLKSPCISLSLHSKFRHDAANTLSSSWNSSTILMSMSMQQQFLNMPPISQPDMKTLRDSSTHLNNTPCQLLIPSSNCRSSSSPVLTSASRPV